jgi:TetR/AcrR family transcriptional regulator of autoinduction and epiphytic fitness
MPPSLFDAALTLPETFSKRDAILGAASRVFIDHGFEGTTMALVADAAGVARRTLYNQFPEGKESLFGAVAERMWKAFPVMDIATDETALSDADAGLRRIGHAVAAFWAPPLAVAFLRMVIAEGRRFPDLIKRFFEVGKTPAVNAVRNYIAELGRRGVLNVSDPVLAATQFLGMIDESVLWVRVMGDERQLTRAQVDKVVEQAVLIFLGHYRAAPQASKTSAGSKSVVAKRSQSALTKRR